MASYLIHNNDNFTIKLVTPTDSTISVSDDPTNVTITIPKGTYMGIGTTIGVGGTDGQYFNYNFCSYVTVVFKNLAGTSKTLVPKASTIATMRPQASEKLSTSYFPGLTDFKEFSNNVVLFHTGNASSDQWNWKETLNSDKTIKVKIPADANSYEVYISGCSMNTTTYRRYIFDPKVNSEYPVTDWTVPAWATNPTSIGGNSCGHQHDSDEFLSSNPYISPNKPLSSKIKPISTDLVYAMTAPDSVTGISTSRQVEDVITDEKYVNSVGYKLELNKYVNSELNNEDPDGVIKYGTPITMLDHSDNSFSARIRPFKKGLNNPISRIHGTIEFRKDGLPTGDFFVVPENTTFKVHANWKLKQLDDGTYELLPDHKYTLVNCNGAFKKTVTATGDVIYTDMADGTNNQEITSTKECPLYRRITRGEVVKRITFDSDSSKNPDFNIAPWLTQHNAGNAETLNLDKWPLTVCPLTFNEGKANESEVLAGTSAVWIDMFAYATTCTFGDELTNSRYIKISDYEDINFYKNRNYSFEYFNRGCVFEEIDGQMVEQTTPVTKEVINNIPILDATKEYKDSHYYIATRFYLSGDIRKSRWLNTGYISYPRAPKKLWYESTHNDKIYVSDSDAPAIDNSKTYIYKEDLRPRLKDTFTWKWDQAFGDIYTPTEPSYYRVFLYLKSKEPRTGTNLTLITSPAYDGYYTYLVNSTNGLASRNLVKKEVDSETIDLNIGDIPCFEMQAKYLTLNLKELGFKSGDYCGCRIISFINFYGILIYSDVDEDSAFYKNLTKKPSNYIITPSNPFTNNISSVTNTDKNLYGSGGYIEDFPNDKSFAEGGCPALEGPDGEKIGYDYNQSLTDCEVRNGAIVWVKVSDEPDDWVEGTPWVKTEDGWKEADSLHVKADNSATGWKESD